MAELIWVLICRSAQDREDGDLDAIGILDRLSLDVFPTELTPLVLVASKSSSVAGSDAHL